jgi:Fe-S-cluster-containing hydrogenase component 2
LLCVEDCPFSAISAHNSMVRVDKEACMGCGVCVTVCDQEAMSLVRDLSKPEPLVIEDLMRQAASR